MLVLTDTSFNYEFLKTEVTLGKESNKIYKLEPFPFFSFSLFIFFLDQEDNSLQIFFKNLNIQKLILAMILQCCTSLSAHFLCAEPLEHSRGGLVD